jgi:hypothetical protein
MLRTPVASSNLRAVGYDPDLHLLEIEFRDGRIYQYPGVPAGVFRGLMNAASKGSYFHNHIEGTYPYRRVR